MHKIGIFLSVIVFLIAGCATPAYKEVFKQDITYNSKEFSVSRDILYKATLITMFAKNFFIEKEDEEKSFILAKRSFQRARRTIVLLLQAKIISDEETKSTLYLDALQTTERSYIADRTRFFLWLVPLPGGGGKEAVSVKEEEGIIKDKEFYQNLFSAVEEQIKKSKENP